MNNYRRVLNVALILCLTFISTTGLSLLGTKEDKETNNGPEYRRKRQSVDEHFVDVKKQQRDMHDLVYNISQSLEKNNFAKPKFQISSSYTPIAYEKPSQNDKEEVQKLKLSLEKIQEELNVKEGRLIELQKQVQKVEIYRDLHAVCDQNNAVKVNDMFSQKADTIIDLLKSMMTAHVKEDSEKMTKEIATLRQELQNKDLKLNEIVETLKESNNIAKTYQLQVKENKNEFREKIGRIIYAVNAGGDAHVDVNGIYFMKDPLEGSGIVLTEYLKDIKIKRVHENDYYLYNTLRGGPDPSGYNIPIKQDGNYVVVLRFAEGYQKKPNARVFNVQLNKLHTAIENLDLYGRATYAVAFEEYIVFSVEKGNLMFKGETSKVNDHKVAVDFVHSKLENVPDRYAFVQAIYVVKGNLTDVLKMPPIHYPQP